MSKKFISLSVFFIVLAVGFVILLSQLNGGEMLRKRNKTISVVQPFKFTSQDSLPITNADIEGKVVLVEYFFTTCTSICPIMNNTMKGIYNEFKNEPNFMVLSHTSDPKNDGPATLKKYADSIGAGKNWIFVTGSKKDLYYHARTSYAVDDANIKVVDPETDFIHTQFFALVNNKGLVKKRVYDSFVPEEMTELKTDIKKALAGEL